MIAVNQTLRNYQGTVEDVIHRVNRRIDGIHRIIVIIIINYDNIIIQWRFKSRLFGLHVFIAFFRKQIFDKSTAAILCT